jgi:hypothetical protein
MTKKKIFIDTDTGEEVELDQIKKNKRKVTSFDKYVGLDTKFPYDCVTTDSLEDTLKVMDAYYTNKPRINFEYLMDSVVGGFIVKSELAMLRFVSTRLSGWNIYIGSLKELTACGTDSANMAKLLKSSKNVRIVSRDKPFKGDIVLEVNPLVAWKGDTEYQQSRLKTWYFVNS